jgi:hypothetical protein
MKILTAQIYKTINTAVGKNLPIASAHFGRSKKGKSQRNSPISDLNVQSGTFTETSAHRHIHTSTQTHI